MFDKEIKKNHRKFCWHSNPPTLYSRDLKGATKKYRNFDFCSSYAIIFTNTTLFLMSLHSIVIIRKIGGGWCSNLKNRWKFKGRTIVFNYKKSQVHQDHKVIWFNSNCRQCHSIFSFEWNLIFTKSNHFFISSLVVWNNKNPKLLLLHIELM